MSCTCVYHPFLELRKVEISVRMLSGNLTITVVAAEAVPQCKEDLVVAEVAEVPQLNCYVEIQVQHARLTT